MKLNQLICLLLSAGISANVYAAKPEPQPQDVNIINTPNVTVTNPQTSVTVNNDSANPVPVTVQGGITVSRVPQFVGFSDTTVNGGVGWPAVNAACSSKFGAGTRICISTEIYISGGPTLPMASDLVYGWVIEDISLGGFGELAGADSICSGFTQSLDGAGTWNYVINSDTGELKTLNNDGAVTETRTSLPGSCASSFHVTCCQ